MPADVQELSQQDVQDLQDIASRLPADHPMRGKIATALQPQSPTAASLALLPNPQQQAREEIKQPILRSGKFPQVQIQEPPIDRMITGARARANEAQNENLATAARTGHGAGTFNGLRRFGYNAAADTGEMVKSAASPVSLGMGAAAAVAPEIALPALAGYGGYEAIKHGVRALKSATANEPGGVPYMMNPEEVGATLSSASTAAGAAAGGADLARMRLRSVGIAEPTTGEILQETAAGAARPLVAAPKAAAGAGAAMIREVGEASGIAAPAEPHEALNKALQPGVNIPRAAESFKIAGARLQQVRQAIGAEINGPADLIPGAPVMQAAKRAVLQGIEQRLGPVAELQRDTSPVARAMEDSISDRLERQNPQAAAAIRERAATYRQPLSIREIEDSIQDANNELRNFYKRSGPTDAPISAQTQATEAEVRALRTLQDKAIQDLTGADDLRDLKREYGALRDVERSAARANLVAARQKPGTLYEGLAALRAAGELLTGNPLGAAKAGATIAMGRYLKNIRGSDYLVDHAFNGPRAFQAAPEISAPPPRAPQLALPERSSPGYTGYDPTLYTPENPRFRGHGPGSSAEDLNSGGSGLWRGPNQQLPPILLRPSGVRAPLPESRQLPPAPRAPISLAGAPDTSFVRGVDAEAQPGTRAERRGLLLPMRTAINLPLGEPGGPSYVRGVPAEAALGSAPAQIRSIGKEATPSKPRLNAFGEPMPESAASTRPTFKTVEPGAPPQLTDEQIRDTRAQIAELDRRARAAGEKVNQARAGSRTGMQYIQRQHNAYVKARQLEEGLAQGRAARPALGGATKAELNATYNSAPEDVRAEVDRLVEQYKTLESVEKARFEHDYGLDVKSGTTKGLPLKEKLARTLTHRSAPNEWENFLKKR